MRQTEKKMLYINRSDQVCRTIEAGGVVALPTEAVWGLSCQHDNLNAVSRTLRIKGRHPEKGLILLVTSFQQLAPWYATELLPEALIELGRPSTWVIPVNKFCPKILTGGRSTLAIRRVSMPSLVKIIDRCGPIVSTSVNRSGRKALTSRRDVVFQFRHYVDTIAYGRTQGYLKPSKIRIMKTGGIVRD